ncbi:MAG: hypothetical protein U0531_04715 [Dehalococcoidia bacterium]
MLGLDGMLRRTYTYPAGTGWDIWNLVSTIGAFTIAVSVLVFILNVIRTAASKRRAPIDPWNARTLEWMIPSPPPEYNFAEIPTVHARDEFWHRKYDEDGGGRAVPRAGVDPSKAMIPAVDEGHGHGEHGHGGHGHGIHMPDPSYYPLIAALGLPLMAYGLIWKLSNPTAGWGLIGIGAVVLLLGVYGWGMEPVNGEE